jgi:lysozyme family protein
MIEATIAKEGGYSNHPADRGGPTNFGITERVARDNGHTGDMRNLTRAQAVAIYRSEYAIKPGFAAVAGYPRLCLPWPPALQLRQNIANDLF